MAESARPISSVILARVMPGRHWSSGFRSTKISAMEMVLGSVPSSGWPALETVVRTSGTDSRALRAMRRMREASAVEDIGREAEVHQVVPSSSSGRNSEPRRAAATMARPNTASAMTTTVRRRSSAQSSTGA